MSIRISTVSNNQSWSTLIERFRQITEIMTSNTVTADGTADGSVTMGNVQLRGIFMSNTLVANGGLRGGNNSSTNTLVITSNTVFAGNNGANTIVINSDITNSNVFLYSNNITISPVANTVIAGPVLNINALTTNITSSVVNGNTTIIQTGNVTIKSNTTTTLATFISNTVTFSSPNLNIASANLYITSNTTVANLLNVTGNTTFSNTIVIASNSSDSNVFFIANNITLNPVANTIITGPVLNINSVNTNITSTLIQTGNTAFKGNTSTTLVTLTGNTALLSAPNTNISSANLYITSNTTVANLLNVIGNTTFSNTITITSNSSTSNVVLLPNNIIISPVANTTITGPILNINAVTTNVTSTFLNTNTVFTQTGNTVFNGNSSTTLVTLTGNTALLSAPNTNISGANLYITSNTTVAGIVNVIGNTTFSNVTVTNVLAVNTLTFTSSNVSLPNTTTSTLHTTGIVTGDANLIFGSNTFIVDTTNSRTSFGTANADPSSTVTVYGTITANTFRFPDGTSIPHANGIAGLYNANSSLAISGTDQIVITSNNQTIAVMDSGANSINFTNGTVKANSLIANVSVTTLALNANTVTINAISIGVANKITTSNLSVQTIDTLSSTTYRCADWTIELEDSSTLSYQMSKLMAIHDGTNTQTTEYAILTTNNTIGTWTTDISGGQFRLRLTPTVFPITIRITRTAITAV